MEEVNALELRNNPGEILDRLRDRGEPILISKDGKIRAVLVTPEHFGRHFLNRQEKEEKTRFLDSVVKRLRKGKIRNVSSLRVLPVPLQCAGREMRGGESTPSDWPR